MATRPSIQDLRAFLSCELPEVLRRIKLQYDLFGYEHLLLGITDIVFAPQTQGFSRSL